jgi:hypothetical protein
MHRHWREPGYTCPNAARYPWLWLWDSCFHSIIWAELGEPDRSVAELRWVFEGQDDATGFVPHMAYVGAPDTAADFWGRSGYSSITQPPMFGHAVAELVRRGVDVDRDVVDSATAGLGFLLRRRRRHATGLVELVHPWESGADDSPRWDDLAGSPRTDDAWYEVKGSLLASVQRSASGAPLSNAAFAVASAGFNALVAFNAIELAWVTGDASLRAGALELCVALDSRWDRRRCTWVDAGPTESGSGAARSADGLLPLLVTLDDAAASCAFESLVDPAAYGGEFGPSGVHRGEPSFDPAAYWRGPAWPQLSYLLWVAAARRGRDDVVMTIARSTARAALVSGMAEYWDPDTGAGGGAVPQSWTGLALVMA